MTLSILSVTQGDPSIIPFLQQLRDLAIRASLPAGQTAEAVFACDGQDAYARVRSQVGGKCILVRSRGHIGSVLDEAVRVCTGAYVFRVDDDETLTAPLQQWVIDAQYRAHDHWRFRRAHLWTFGEAMGHITNGRFWPDYQTRLSVREKSGQRVQPHAASPYGRGQAAPDNCVIEHWKFMLKSRAEREQMRDRYDRIAAGAGKFSVPEDAYPHGPNIAPWRAPE